jgi:hypothetical protein
MIASISTRSGASGVLLAVALLLASCGGGGGGGGGGGNASAVAGDGAPLATPPTVTVTLANDEVNVGNSTNVNWSSTGASTCTGSAGLSGSLMTSGSQSVTGTTAGTVTYTVTCSNDISSTAASAVLAVQDPTSNRVPIVFDDGPAASKGFLVNIPFVNVTVCQPGGAVCVVIDHVLLDTGSYGLRLTAQALGSLQLAETTGAPIGECGQFADGYTWGAVRTADVRLGDELASSVSIQVIADPALPFASVPSSCSSTGAAMNSASALHANGILGIGLFPEDCGPGCVNGAPAGFYYDCSVSPCTPTSMALASQITNPIVDFAVDNNGSLLQVSSSASSFVTFGIGTQANNAVTAQMVVITADQNGNFATAFNGFNYPDSFLDSGSNSYFFANTNLKSRLPNCPSSSVYYCPAAAQTFSANITGNNAIGENVSFTVDDADAVPLSLHLYDLGASLPKTLATGVFDWGLPFFIDRPTFTAIYGQTTPSGVGPYWAF